MRIGCLQFSPQVGDVYNNLNRADAVLNRASAQETDGLDLLVLPELAFTGYNFRSLAEISPYLEPSGSGISALWARTTALKLNCNVVVGYPEKVDVTQKWPASPEFYNSAIIVSKDGETIANYRKSFLYAIDETWALEGRDGFFEGYIPDLGNVAMGICMDLNPYRFEAPWHDFEFAFHVLEVEANVVILTMAWLTREGAHAFSQQPQEPDLQTLEYWVQRLEPVIRKDSEEEIIVVFCNRCGTEGTAVYAGTSSVIGVKNGEINLYGVLGRGVKELLVIDTDKAPFAKLLQTGQSRKASVGKSDGQSSVKSVAGSSVRSTPFPSKTSFFPFRDTSHSESRDDESIGTPIDDIEDAWEIMSNTASHGSAPSSYSQSGPMPPRSSLPKLELQIPTAPEEPLHLSQSKGPVSATRARDGKSPAVGGDDIPTPTAPSPTPMSVRPHFDLPDKGPAMSMLSHIDLPDIKPPISKKGDIIPSSVNMKAGGAVKVGRVDTPITPPWIVGTKEKARTATPISEAPPSPPSDEETGTGDLKAATTTGKKSPKLKGDHTKGSSLKISTDQGRGGKRNTFRPRASSLKTEVGKVRSFPSAAASATVGLDTATPTTTTATLDSIWGDALRQLKSGNSNITEDSMYRHDDVDDILVGESSSNLGRQDELFVEVEQKFAHLTDPADRRPSPALNGKSARSSTEEQKRSAPDVDTGERHASPAPTTIPNRPPSTKSRNASLPRAPQSVDSSDLRRSMSQSRMSIPIVASPSVFHQEHLSHLQARHTESPIYFRPESKVSNNPVNGSGTPSNVANGTGVWMKQANRPVSRGRQPLSKPNGTNGTSTQNTQWSNGHAGRANGSVDRGRRSSIHRTTETASRPGAPSAKSLRDRSMSNTSASMLFGTPPRTVTQPPLDPGDEIIAMINLIHNDCPVHNSRAPSLEPQMHSQVQTEQQDHAAGGQQGRPTSQQRSPQQRPRQSTPRVQTPVQQQQQQQQQSQTPVAHGNEAEPVYEIILPPHIRELVESLSSPESRIQSPLRALDLLKPDRTSPKFDPPTPTAMQFDINDSHGKPASA